MVYVAAISVFATIFLPFNRIVTRRWILARERPHQTNIPSPAITVPLIDRLEIVIRNIQAGAAPTQALSAFNINDCEHVDHKFVSGTLRAAQKAGPGAVIVLQHLTEVLRRRKSARELRVSQAATATVSAKVLTVLPLIAGTLMCVLDQRVRHFLIGSSTGWFCIVMACLLNIAADKVMNRIISGTTITDATAEVIDAISVGLVATGSIVGAIAWAFNDAGCQQLDGCINELELGSSVHQVLDRMQRDLGSTSAPLIAAIRAHHQDGLPISPTLERIRNFALMQQDRNSEASARGLPVRLSFPLVFLVLPAFALVTIVPLLAGALASIGTQMN